MPDGYKNTEGAWLNPDATTLRINFATALARGNLPVTSPPAISEPQSVADPPPVPVQKGEPVDAVRLEKILGSSLAGRDALIETPAGSHVHYLHWREFPDVVVQPKNRIAMFQDDRADATSPSSGERSGPGASLRSTIVASSSPISRSTASVCCPMVHPASARVRDRENRHSGASRRCSSKIGLCARTE
jgi:hypothetical protein